MRDGISLGSQRVTRPIVSYPQILELEDLDVLCVFQEVIPLLNSRLNLRIGLNI
ncbi:hypothetical protein PGH45_19215 [Legionella pneumophila]|nr:hypothetical protein [Legionella pneumophila]